MVSIHKVAHTALDYAIQEGYNLERYTSSLKMQRICYIVQGWNAVWTKTRLIDEDFYMWNMGPVNPDLQESPVIVTHHTNEEGDTYYLKEEEYAGDEKLSDKALTIIHTIVEAYKGDVSNEGVISDSLKYISLEPFNGYVLGGEHPVIPYELIVEQFGKKNKALQLHDTYMKAKNEYDKYVADNA